MVLNKAEELISSIARRGALDEEEAERLIKLIRSQEVTHSSPSTNAIDDVVGAVSVSRSSCFHLSHWDNPLLDPSRPFRDGSTDTLLRVSSHLHPATCHRRSPSAGAHRRMRSRAAHAAGSTTKLETTPRRRSGTSRPDFVTPMSIARFGGSRPVPPPRSPASARAPSCGTVHGTSRMSPTLSAILHHICPFRLTP